MSRPSKNPQLALFEMPASIPDPQQAFICCGCKGTGGKECAECEGEGVSTCCECEQGRECPECDGSGFAKCLTCHGTGSAVLALETLAARAREYIPAHVQRVFVSMGIEAGRGPHVSFDPVKLSLYVPTHVAETFRVHFVHARVEAHVVSPTETLCFWYGPRDLKLSDAEYRTIRDLVERELETQARVG